MMTGTGPVRRRRDGRHVHRRQGARDQKPGDYRDPGWYKQPKGTRAYEWTGPIAAATRSHDAGKGAMRPAGKPQSQEVVVRKPVSHGQH